MDGAPCAVCHLLLAVEKTDKKSRGELHHTNHANK